MKLVLQSLVVFVVIILTFYFFGYGIIQHLIMWDHFRTNGGVVSEKNKDIRKKLLILSIRISALEAITSSHTHLVEIALPDALF